MFSTREDLHSAKFHEMEYFDQEVNMQEVQND